jgi:Zn-dependent M28 family amino/carboxypeptidase
MTRLLTLALLVPSVLAAQQSRAGGITAAEIDGHLRFLSSDALEGRAPASRGGRLAAEYIASQLRGFGLRAGLDSSYFQTVPIDVVTAEKSSMKLAASDKATATLRFPEDVVVWAGSAVPQSAAKGELVFVGYGAHAPEYNWDDYKDVDVKGKILLVLVNDPPAPSTEPNLFGGRGMTYYGRWTYKFEEAERRGAAGMLIVHTTEQAGYGWQTVVGSWAAGNRMLPRPADQPPPLGARGWITDSAATALLRHAGLDLAELRTRATRRDFRPVPTGITMDIAFRNAVQNLKSENVVGVVRGSDPALRDQYVAFSAHWDHFGIGPAVNGDSIYNGALDNASGTADLLAIARAAAAAPAPRRSLVFIFVTGEESGLLGSKFYAEHPTVPAEKIVANLNVDGGNLLGRSRDLRVLGENKSSLGPALKAFVRPRAMALTPDEHPERGYFYRSDHFSFAKAGIPSVSIAAGSDYVGKPKGWGLEQEEDYTNKRYHQPSDEYRPDFDLSGAVQLSEIVLGFGRQIANMSGVPSWNADAEFRALRKPITE